MEIQLIYGPNDSGKSKYAEEVAAASGNNLVYLATMVPQNEDNYKRIEKHRIQRKDKGFRTIEMGWNIGDIEVDSETVVLLEDASNLLANGIFAYGETAEKVLEDILVLANRCKKLIIVSISGLMPEDYDVETASYIEQLNWLNEKLTENASVVVEIYIDDNGKSRKYVRKAARQHYSFFSNRECDIFLVMITQIWTTLTAYFAIVHYMCQEKNVEEIMYIRTMEEKIVVSVLFHTGEKIMRK